MKWAILLLAFYLHAGAARANECESAGAAGEQAMGLPADLLVAVGRVESGRRGADGRVAPWPWSVNAAGEGHYLASAAEAVALVQSLQARGVRSIDVGCFQVNLLFHPDAFATLAAAFDPAANALAAARFLHALHDATQDWDAAVGRYHSADPGLGIPYMRQVLASWRGGPAMPSPILSQVAALVRVIVPQAYARAEAAALPGLVRGLPVVIVPSSRL